MKRADKGLNFKLLRGSPLFHSFRLFIIFFFVEQYTFCLTVRERPLFVILPDMIFEEMSRVSIILRRSFNFMCNNNALRARARMTRITFALYNRNVRYVSIETILVNLRKRRAWRCNTYASLRATQFGCLLSEILLRLDKRG